MEKSVGRAQNAIPVVVKFNDPHLFTHKEHYPLKSEVSSVQFSSSVVSDSATPSIAGLQASLSITNSQSSLRLTSNESVMPSSHLILSSLSAPAPKPSQHQSAFQRVKSSHEVANVLEFQF